MEELIVENEEWARGLARLIKLRSFPYPNVTREDVEGLAMIGLCKAANKWDPTHPAHASFRTFARYGVIRAILDHYRRGRFRDETHGPLSGSEPCPVSIDEQLDRQKRAAVLHRIMSRVLNPKQKRIVVLVSKGQSSRDVAKVLRMRWPEVEKIYNQALAAISGAVRRELS